MEFGTSEDWLSRAGTILDLRLSTRRSAIEVRDNVDLSFHSEAHRTKAESQLGRADAEDTAGFVAPAKEQLALVTGNGLQGLRQRLSGFSAALICLSYSGGGQSSKFQEPSSKESPTSNFEHWWRPRRLFGA